MDEDKQKQCKNCGHIKANHFDYEEDCSTECKLPGCDCTNFR
jgi:hypothetical protein